MKLEKRQEGGWRLSYRSYFMLCIGGVFLGCAALALRGTEENLAAALILLLVGLLALYYFAEFSTLTITGDRLCHSRSFFLWQRETSRHRAELVSLKLEMNPMGRSQARRMRFAFADGTVIHMPRAFVGSTIGWRMDEIFESVRALFPELQRDSSDEILALLEAGHRIKAIHCVQRQYGLGLTEARKFVDELKSD